MKLNTINIVEVIKNGRRHDTIIVTTFSSDLKGQEQAKERFIELATSAGYIQEDWQMWDYSNEEYRIVLRHSDYAPDNA